MSKTLGQPIVIENVVGAGGTTGVDPRQARRARRLHHRHGPHGHACRRGRALSQPAYDPVNDFEPIGLAAGTPVLILAKKDFPPKDLKEFVAYVKANENKLNMAHAGVGSVSFTTCLLLNSILQVKPTSIPYQGTGPSMNALVGGQVDYMCDQIVNAVPQINGGTIKAYAIGTEERNPALPNVPTTKEAGLPEFQASAWNALFAPKGTPKDDRRQALGRARQGARRRGHPQAPPRARQRHSGQGPPRRPRAAHPGEERDRQVDPGHQGGGVQN